MAAYTTQMITTSPKWIYKITRKHFDPSQPIVDLWSVLRYRAGTSMHATMADQLTTSGWQPVLNVMASIKYVSQTQLSVELAE